MLLGPDGSPITYRKDRPKALGPSFGSWGADRQFEAYTLPGGAILQFDLDRLTLADYRAMRYHPQINSSLSVLTFMLHQVEWHIECSDAKIATQIEDQMRLIWTRLVRGMSQAFWAGHSPMAIEYENNLNEKRVDISKIKDLVPEDCQIHWKEVEGSYRPPDFRGEWIPPKFKVYDGIDQWGSKYTIPPENTLWYPLLMENGDYSGRKLLKAAFTPWYFSTLIHLFANRYYERFGEPLPIGRAPFDEEFPVPASASGETISGKDAMEIIVRNIRNRSVAVLPSDRQQIGSSTASEYMYSIEYLESQMRGVDFERYMSRLDEEMSLALFTPLLLLRNADVGSHNLGVQHTQTWLWMLNALTGDMKEYIDRYIIDRLKAYNFSPNAPRAEWVPRRLGKENVETLRAIISELLRGGKVKPDIEELGIALGMKLTEVREVTEEPPDEDDPSGRDDRDDRVGRDRPGSDGPRGVGEPRATGREISNRLLGQVEKAWKEARFDALRPQLGYRRRFHQALVSEGCSPEKADQLTDQFYTRVERWLNEAVAIGHTQYESPRDFMSMVDRLIDTEIEQLRG